jgi:hypothetical protein
LGVSGSGVAVHIHLQAVVAVIHLAEGAEPTVSQGARLAVEPGGGLSADTSPLEAAAARPTAGAGLGRASPGLFGG